MQAFGPWATAERWCGLLVCWASGRSCRLCGWRGLEEGMDRWRSLQSSPSTFFDEVSRGDDAAVAVQMELQTTVCAADLLPFLPQSVTGVALVLLFKGAVQAWAVDVIIEGLFIRPFVDIGSTLGALEVACCLLIVVLVMCGWPVELVLEQVPDDLGTGELLCRPGSFLSWLWACLLCNLLIACFAEALFELLGGETLVHACSAGGAGITTALRGPPVEAILPGFGALLNEVLFPLFGVLAWLPVCFGMEVVLLILEDKLKALCCVKIDGFVVPVQCVLPAGLAPVMECVSSLPCSQSGISLPPAELWLISWCVGGSGVFADVQDGNAVSVLWGDLSQEVWVGMLVGWLLPCLPDCSKLDNHLGRSCGVLGQCNQSSKKCSALALVATCCSSDGSQAFELPHRLSV